MKINRRNNSRTIQKRIIIGVMVFVVTAVTTWFAYSYFYADQSHNTASSDNDSESSHQSTTTESNTTSSSENSASSSGTATTEDTPAYVDTPITNPSANDPYPIENAHYSIEQFSATEYSITLYPIANNPGNSDYTKQLADYRAEALGYLKERYGDISHFTITYNPKAADGL